MKKNKSVDEYIAKKEQWQKELNLLRNLLNSTELEETVKWGGPCYTVQGKNVVGLATFKKFIALWFFQGALLKDNGHVLINAQEGTTKALRQWRFGSMEEIDLKRVKEYVAEAIDNQKKGKQIKPDRKKPLIIPPELNQVFEKNKNIKYHFEELTRSKQREFSDYIVGAKRTETKENRLEKILPMILRKEGLNDKYRK